MNRTIRLQQDHRSECGRAVLVLESDTLGRPHRSVPSLGILTVTGNATSMVSAKRNFPADVVFRANMSACFGHNEMPAFTLVEFLVVVAIIGILAALLLTALTQGKRKAHAIVCVGNLRQLDLALQQFVAENHAYPLLRNPNFLGGTVSDGSGLEGDYPGHSASWIDSLNVELQKPLFEYRFKEVWVCPSAKPPLIPIGGRGPYCFYGYNGLGMSAPTQIDATSLGLGGRIFEWHFSRHNPGPPPTRDPVPPVSESDVARPSAMMAIGDGLRGSGEVVFDGTALLQRTRLAFGGLFRDQAAVSRAKLRHQGKANVVFCDGHVESPTLQFLFEDTSDEALSRWNRDDQPHREALLK